MSLYGENGYNRGGCFSDDKSHNCKADRRLHAVSLVYRVDDVDASYAYQLFNKLTQGRDRNEGATRFVARLYRNVLGREYDVPGLNTWCNTICDKKQSVEYVSTVGFFHSKEFQNKQLSDKEFVDVLYQTFFDREYDAEGMQYWLNEMQQKRMTRDQVLYYFANSKEFQTIRTKYGF